MAKRKLPRGKRWKHDAAFERRCGRGINESGDWWIDARMQEGLSRTEAEAAYCALPQTERDEIWRRHRRSTRSLRR